MSKGKRTATLWGGPHRAGDQEALQAFADWLARPGELGKRPDRMRIIDHRIMNWPSKGVEWEFWVIQFWLGPLDGRDQEVETGIGVVYPPKDVSYFPDVYRFTNPDIAHWLVEDVYARKLARDLSAARRLKIDDSACGQRVGVDLEERLKFVSFEKARRVATATVRLPERSLAGEVLIGEVRGVEMVAVVDPEGIHTYSRDEFYGGAGETTILEVHLMRGALGFPLTVERKPTHPRLEPTPPDVVVERWRKQEREVRALPIAKQKAMLRPSLRPLAGFELIRYARALKDMGQAQSILATIEWLESAWGDRPTTGWEYLGRAADICGFPEQAEKYLALVREKYSWYFLGDDLHSLARIYHDTARPSESKRLLLDCIQGSLRYAKECKGTDRLNAERNYQAHRRLYLELFPEGAEELRSMGLPGESW